jgi:hypothetical protein
MIITFKEDIMKTKSLNKAAILLGRKGGKAKSPSKQAASRENGKKGGRPKTVK